MTEVVVSMTAAEKNHVDWLVEQSMLHAARQRAKLYSGQGRLWQQPYAHTRPRDASALASVWFTAYPASIVTREDGSVLEALGDETLWHALSRIGIQGIHNGPLKTVWRPFGH
jgi:hypothetical protein